MSKEIFRRLKVRFHLMIPILKTFLDRAIAQGSRSTVLRPLVIMMSICVMALLTCIQFKAPNGLIYFFAIFSGLTMVQYLFTHIFCLFTDKDALRSEKFIIQKMAIEKSVIGDNIVGTLEREKLDVPFTKVSSDLTALEDDK